MVTRRAFLQSSSIALVNNTYGMTRSSHPQCTSGPTSRSSPVERDYWNDLPTYLASHIDKARGRRISALRDIGTPPKAAVRASFVSSRLWRLIGGPLPKSPLNVRTTGVVNRKTYRIEKLVFESQPRFYVPAHLYIPSTGESPCPVVLAPLGHAQEGKLFRSYQILFQNLANKGFAVFTWDPPGQGERLQYLTPGTDRSPFSSVGEHEQFGWPALLIGSTTTQFEVWDAVRALDYLASRHEVDMNRLGCCGHSGGGTQTMFLCALEPRIRVAVIVEGHTENVAGAAYEPPGAYADAEQNIIGGLQVGIDRGDLLCSFAPRPLLVCYTAMDVGVTYSPHYERGTYEIVDECRRIYSTYAATDRIRLFRSTLPHDYDFFHRQETYKWLNTWLHGHADASELDFEESPDAMLWCTSTGQVMTAIGGRPAYQVNADHLHDLEKVRAPLSAKNTRETLSSLLALPSSSNKMGSRTISNSAADSVSYEEFEIINEDAVRIPGWVIRPKPTLSKLPAVMYVSNRKDTIFSDVQLIRLVTEKHVAVCAIELRGLGRCTPRSPSAGPLFYAHGVDLAYSLICLVAGIPLAGQRTSDILLGLEYLMTCADVDTSRVGLFARGSQTFEAFYAAVLDTRFRTILLERHLLELGAIVASRTYDFSVASVVPGFLKYFDFPQLSSAIAPRPLWLANPVGPNGDTATSTQLGVSYDANTKIVISEPITTSLTNWVDLTLL